MASNFATLNDMYSFFPMSENDERRNEFIEEELNLKF